MWGEPALADKTTRCNVPGQAMSVARGKSTPLRPRTSRLLPISLQDDDVTARRSNGASSGHEGRAELSRTKIKVRRSFEPRHQLCHEKQPLAHPTVARINLRTLRRQGCIAMRADFHPHALRGKRTSRCQTVARSDRERPRCGLQRWRLSTRNALYSPNDVVAPRFIIPGPVSSRRGPLSLVRY